jgi:hypothetical protein
MPRRSDGKMASVECLQQVLRALVAERQALRERSAGRKALESKRLEVARRQRELSHALIDQYLRRGFRHYRVQSSFSGEGGLGDIARRPLRTHNPRSQVQILPPLLREAPETGPFCLFH